MRAGRVHRRDQSIIHPSAHRGLESGIRIAESEAAELELDGALATLYRSKSVAEAVLAHHKTANPVYWFARLYYYITKHEIEARESFAYPGFVMHFIPIFFELYAENAERFSRGEPDEIVETWRSHFSIGSLVVDPSRLCAYCDAVTRSVFSGVSTHIKVDMPIALETTYRSYKSRYHDAGPFDRYYDDLFDRNRPIFVKVRLALINELIERILNHYNMRTDPTFVSRIANAAGVGLSIDEIYKWRNESWHTTRLKLDQGPGKLIPCQAGEPRRRRPSGVRGLV